jgi:7,8-dihydro-6-hydroxymethylpterin dimethyltransferase
MQTEVLLGVTESVCPECLKRIPAQKIIDDDRVYLVKECPEHGIFRVLIWRGKPAYASWGNQKIPSTPTICATEVEHGCPFDCGLCPDHRQQTCCVVLEVTERCNLYCPICFADVKQSVKADPDLAVIESWYRMLLASGGPYNIQLSGGEPTVREDLPEIIRLGHKLGFEFIQLNTNGLRLARDPYYVEQLKEAGLNCVFLQFDGVSDEIHQTLRGAALMEAKVAALDHCAKYGIGVVLVPTLVPDVNISNIGAIIRFAIERMPHIRGVHFQPISYFGRYPDEPPATRMTIPEIIQEIENQTAGQLKMEHFRPPGGENAYCSFHGNFILMSDGELKPWASPQATKCCAKPGVAAEGAKNARRFVAKQWSAPTCGNCGDDGSTERTDRNNGINTDSLDAFLEQVNTYTLAISGMAFQDAWTLELDRLRDCLIHVVSPDGKLIPFCAYNLTARDGRSIYRKQAAPE